MKHVPGGGNVSTAWPMTRGQLVNWKRENRARYSLIGNKSDQHDSKATGTILTQNLLHSPLLLEHMSSLPVTNLPNTDVGSALSVLTFCVEHAGFLAFCPELLNQSDTMLMLFSA